MKKNKFEFIIDTEFQSQIPALTDEEFQQLEENILFEGEVLSPLIVWGNILVDGHNRYKILQQHPEIPYTTRSISCKKGRRLYHTSKRTAPTASSGNCQQPAIHFLKNFFDNCIPK